MDYNSGFALDWSDLQSLQSRRVHIYSRTQRFRTVLAHLVGFQLSVQHEKGDCWVNAADRRLLYLFDPQSAVLELQSTIVKPPVPVHVVDHIRQHINIRKCSRNRLWNNIRKILKRDGPWQRYYTRIPYIIQELGGPLWILKSDTLSNVLANFAKLHWVFNRFKCKLGGRKYFPPLMYVALRLLLAEGVLLPYTIPLARTIRKRNSLNDLFQHMAELTDYEDPWVTKRKRWIKAKCSQWGVRR